MNPVMVIQKKRRGLPLSQSEIEFLVEQYVAGDLPDYQMAALLMAIFFQGMTAAETALLTTAYWKSGTSLAWPRYRGRVFDKHSTGGVGDKTSLLLAPLLSTFDLKVPMMAGRGLGHTGGTLDKLESIAGFKTQLSQMEVEKQIDTIGCGIFGQTKEMVPADRKIYALRDVTGTVESLPLICASILSKKKAEDLDGLVMDVKFGSGAFMKTRSLAQELATALTDLGAELGLPVRAVLSCMDQPLGSCVGNTLEVEECLQILQGNSPSINNSGIDLHGDTLALTLKLGAEMLVLANLFPTASEAKQALEARLQSGQALEQFYRMCRAQGAIWPIKLPTAKHSLTISANQDGFFNVTDAESLGWASIELGAGRRSLNDTIDCTAGFEMHTKAGAAVKVGETLFVLKANDAHRFAAAKDLMDRGFQILPEPPLLSPLIV